MRRKILFLVPYPLEASPSQRFRFEQYFPILESHGYHYHVQTFLTNKNWRVFYGAGSGVMKVQALANGFLRRVRAVFMATAYDFIFIHREGTPLGPPLLEWLLAKVLGKKIIYDFDDAIWLTDRPDESLILRIGKWRSKVASICRWAHKVSCGNEYLCNYAASFAKNVVYNPTTIDTESLHRRSLNLVSNPSDTIRIGWTGSHSTLKYLEGIEPALQKILLLHPHVEVLVIADRPPSFGLASLIKFIPWNKESEIQDLLRFDIGIMPLPDDEWAKGKCGFKALQYMALELPTVASPVGVNSKIIDHGKNGFLCRTNMEWEEALVSLIRDATLRKKMGLNGRKKVVENYSVRSNSGNFLSLFE